MVHAAVGRRRVEDALEGRLGHGHDRDVEDRHDRAEHHHAGDQQHATVELVVAALCGLRGGGLGRHLTTVGRSIDTIHVGFVNRALMVLVVTRCRWWGGTA